MQDQSKTKKKELLQELASLKQRVLELDQYESERRRTEEALQESEEKFRFIVDNSMMPMIISSLKDYTVLFYNIFASEFFSDTSLPGTIKASDYWVRPFERDIFIGKLKVKGYVKEYEAELKTASGEHKWCLLSARIINYLGNPASFVMFNDITELKHAKEALYKEEREKSAILDAMSEIVIYLDTNMRIVWSNSATNQQFNVTSDQINGRHCYEALHKLNTHCKICPVVKVFATGEPHIIDDHSSYGKRWTLRAYPVQNEKGEVIGVVEIVADISERKRAEREKYRSEKLQGVLEMAGAVCHELNQPMQIISGYSEMLLMNTSENFPIHAKLDMIIKQIQRMGVITEKLMMIKDYETQDYAGFSRIIDINKSSAKDKN